MKVCILFTSGSVARIVTGKAAECNELSQILLSEVTQVLECSHRMEILLMQIMLVSNVIET